MRGTAEDWDGNTVGGLLRWDHKTEKVLQFNVDAVITSIAHDGGALYLGAADRIMALQGGSLSGYFVDHASGGRYRVAARKGAVP